MYNALVIFCLMGIVGMFLWSIESLKSKVVEKADSKSDQLRAYNNNTSSHQELYRKVMHMILTDKVKFCTDNKQQTKLFQTAGDVRSAYNWALAFEQQSYKEGKRVIKAFSRKYKQWGHHVLSFYREYCSYYDRWHKGCVLRLYDNQEE